MRTTARGRLCCDGACDQLSSYLDGELSERQRARLDQHLAWCPSCRRILTNLGRTMAGLRRLGKRAVTHER
jgi:anti-sigma factor RsiW